MEASPPKPWTLLKERDFSLLLTGQFVSALGDKLHYVALGVLVYRLTGSALDVGKVTLATFLPYLLFGLIAGAYVDRWDKKKTMIAADLSRAFLVSLIPFVIGYSLNLVYLISFLCTTANLFFSPARMAVIPAIFKKGDILTATSLDESAQNITEVLGFALAGIVTVLIQIEHVFFLDALTFLVSAFTIFLMGFKFEKIGGAGEEDVRRSTEGEASVREEAAAREKASAKGDAGKETADEGGIKDTADEEGMGEVAGEESGAGHVWQDILAGLVYIMKTRILADTLLTYCIVLVFFSGFNPLVFVYALQALGVSPVGLGVLEATMAVGITFGSFALVAWGGRFSKRGLMLAGFFLSGVTISALGLYPWYPLALVCFFFSGVSNSLFLIPIQSIFQEETKPSMRGRVFSARFATTRAAFLVSVAVLSFLANKIGVNRAYLFSGVALLLTSFVLLARGQRVEQV
ncbi:MFS transporter [Acididesulfobacillus acetoxydans]|uniref:MFS transporter n=1 Tax=Acididesulfobacillus acetoxydans TaxID=1561005 RepID=UPI001F0EB4F9|nr:MFS transporter [Acididesulfobacillus acetoxydans]